MQTKSSLKNSRVICAVIIFAVVFLFGYKSTNAATLEINSNLNTIYTGDLVTLTVLLNSEGVAINNAEATIVFPTDSMEIVSINKINSVFSLWVEDPTFSNFAGTISFNGGIPTPGFNGTQGLVLSIVAKAKKTGLAEFTFSNAAVRSNDGLGTDVMRVKQGRTITIAKDKEQPILIVTNPTSNLQLSSLTHPNQDQWYKDSNPKFQWVVSEVVDAVQTGIGSNTSSVPQIIYSPAISEKTNQRLG